MARRYSRDNRGRFASGGSGATARGGRLKTASGNTRATQTSKLTKRATQSGAIRKTDVITARVQNAISKNVQQKNPKSGEGPASRVARAERQISARQSRPGTAAANGKPNATRADAANPASAQGRIKQFTDMKKVTDTEVRKVRQQIKDARSNATTFGAVPGLRLRLLELQSQSKRHKDTIASAKASIQK